MADIYKVSWEDLWKKIWELDKKKKYYGIPRGGTVIANMTGRAVATPEEADVIIDDYRETGKTAEEYLKYAKPIYFLYDTKQKDIAGKTIVMPYEINSDMAMGE